MMLPFQKMLFDLRDLRFWIEAQKPTQIEMNDGQYAWFAHMSRANQEGLGGRPIVFTDAPTRL
jgi:hypothetical protein